MTNLKAIEDAYFEDIFEQDGSNKQFLTKGKWYEIEKLFTHAVGIVDDAGYKHAFDLDPDSEDYYGKWFAFEHELVVHWSRTLKDIVEEKEKEIHWTKETLEIVDKSIDASLEKIQNKEPEISIIYELHNAQEHIWESLNHES